MGKPNKRTTYETQLIRDNFSVFQSIGKNRFFLIIIGLTFLAAGLFYDQPHIAMWIGFALAGYAAIANDSIQTIGTFIASNRDKRWWYLWLYMGGIFLITSTYSWLTYNGDVSYERLAAKGFEETPTEFLFLQIAAPIFLLILTRLRMPVSTTFLILSCFATKASAITGVLAKSLTGYFVAFICAIILWSVLSRIFRKYFVGEAAFYWTILQWITSGALWAVWLMQDAANIAVYLPRSLSTAEFLGFAIYIFLGLGLLFRLRGDRIQSIVTQKSDVTDVRPATVIDFIYAIILYYFKIESKIPMSTTWVFLGLLAGREIAKSLTDEQGKRRPMMEVMKIIGRDLLYALIGLAVSMALALGVNEKVRTEIFEMYF